MRRLVAALATLALLVAFMPATALAGRAVFKVNTITVTVDGPEETGSNCEITVTVTYEPAANRIKGIAIQQLRNTVAISTPYALPTSTGSTSYEFHEVALGDHANWNWVAWIVGGGRHTLGTAQYSGYFQYVGGTAYTCPAGAVIAQYPA